MRCVWEHNGNDTLLYSVDYIGAYTRGANLELAAKKMNIELKQYATWLGQEMQPAEDITVLQEKRSDLQIADADSDVLFDTETAPLSMEEYLDLKGRALKSAADFHALYTSVPNQDESCLPHRKSFYGAVPRTANEMYAHTKSVNAYYFGEIGVDADNDGTIYDCRKRAFDRLEQMPDFLSNPVTEGSYGELWSLRKLLRRFIWHDRIHAKAMYRMAVNTFGGTCVQNPFHFIL